MNDFSFGARILGRYRIVRPLGRGGMGMVYLGRMEGAAGLGRAVAIKRVHSALAERLEVNQMFAREARILGGLQHPNLVNVIDFDIEDGAYVMVLEYVHGYDLDHWVRFTLSDHRQLSSEHVLYVVRRVLAALQHAHDARLPDGAPANIVHRDVSLSNVLLDLAGQVKLHDFGIARIDDDAAGLTQTGVFKGKLAMAAPEQLQGLSASRQSDVYATALMTYQLLSGQNPLQGHTEAETIFRIAEHVPPPLSALRADLPRGLDEVVARGLAKVPTARFESAAEFADRLAVFCTRPDEVVVRELVVQLERDFALLPERLGVESLGARDAAWREAQTTSNVVVPLRSFRAAAPDEPLADGKDPAPPVPRVEPVRAAPRASPPRWAKPLVVPLAAGAVALVLLVLTAGRNVHKLGDHAYLVLEAPQGDQTAIVAASPSVATQAPGPAGAALPVAAEARIATAAAAEHPRLVERKPAPGAHLPVAPAAPNPTELSRRFRAHQPEVEACFRSHSDPAVDVGRLSLRFEVNRSGQVTRVNVLPADTERTAIGRCLLAVATRTRFGLLSEPAAFTIPITARRGAPAP